MKRIILTLIFIFGTVSFNAGATTFKSGSLIIPMDTDYQDEGMLKAYGLVYNLLLNNVKVNWIINPHKTLDGTDFYAEAEDIETGESINSEYRGGPFVIENTYAATALPLIEAWQQNNTTTVHRATADFDAYVSKVMITAPTIGVFADGNEIIAFGYLNAAGIPDSLGQSWPDAKDNSLEYPGYPDVLSVDEVRGTVNADNDGILFDEEGIPVYCQIMSMHWGVNERDDDAIAEMRAFLNFPTHLFAECQAVNAIENSINGHFLTPNGYIMDEQPSEVDFINPHLPFAQIDGTFVTVGGSEPSYSLPDGDTYYDQGVVMITEHGTDIGIRDVWMTGYLDGICEINIVGKSECESNVGKISYLGGHKYSTKVPISTNPDTQGARLFLNSLFEADCVTAAGQPRLLLNSNSNVPWTPDDHVTQSVLTVNSGKGIANDVMVIINFPTGASLGSATPLPLATFDGSAVWDLGSISPEESKSLIFESIFVDFGEYEFTASASYRSGQNIFDVNPVTFTTIYSLDPPDTNDTDDIDDSLSDSDDSTDINNNSDNNDNAFGVGGCTCGEHKNDNSGFFIVFMFGFILFASKKIFPEIHHYK